MSEDHSSSQSQQPALLFSRNGLFTQFFRQFSDLTSRVSRLTLYSSDANFYLMLITCAIYTALAFYLLSIFVWVLRTFGCRVYCNRKSSNRKKRSESSVSEEEEFVPESTMFQSVSSTGGANCSDAVSSKMSAITTLPIEPLSLHARSMRRQSAFYANQLAGRKDTNPLTEQQIQMLDHTPGTSANSMKRRLTSMFPDSSETKYIFKDLPTILDE